MSAAIDTSGEEVFYDVNTNSLVGNTSVQFLYPPDLYNHGGQTLDVYETRPDDRIVNADVAFLKLLVYEDPDQDNAYNNGDFSNSNTSGAFWASDPNDYFYKYSASDTETTAPALERASVNPKIGEAIRLPEGSSGATFENRSYQMWTTNVNRFDDIEVDGLNEGIKANTMPALAIRLEGAGIEDVTYRCFDAITVTGASTTITNAKDVTNGAAHFAGIDADLVDEPKNLHVEEDGLYTSGVSYVSAVEIVNVERELGDDRYGGAEDDLPFIFTGASHTFTDAQLTTTGGSGVEGGSSVPIDIDVWGGDCYVGLHTFKVTDTTYSLTDPEKLLDGTGTADVEANIYGKWKYLFDKNKGVGASKDNMSRPFPLKGAAQTITVLLESEVNPEVVEKPPHNKYDYNVATALPTDAANLPVPQVDYAGQIRSVFKYRYNLDYTKENIYKVFSPYQSFAKNLNTFGARALYSDQKIYNTDVEGFDRFRALNFYDLDETNGSISNIVEVADKLFAIQESAVSYVPIQAQILETATGSDVSVRSGEIIGIPIKIDTLYGTQHPRSVKTDAHTFFFVDKRRGEVCMFDGKSVQLISRIGMKEFWSTELPAITPHSDIHAIYDNKNKEYIVYSRGSKAAVFSAINGVWTSRYPEAAATNTLSGLMVDNTMMVLGVGTNNDLDIANIYGSGTIGSWWGTSFTPTAKLIVNPEADMSKTFDGFSINSTLEPDPQSFVVINYDGSLSTADLSAAVINFREGTFRLKNLRDATGKRSRGLYGELEIDLGVAAQSGMTSAVTKYRASKKPI